MPKLRLDCPRDQCSVCRNLKLLTDLGFQQNAKKSKHVLINYQYNYLFIILFFVKLMHILNISLC